MGRYFAGLILQNLSLQVITGVGIVPILTELKIDWTSRYKTFANNKD
tara:strand:- start:344 stop:484 length:141 start_codon:yes stop_codon:yes gene_type:complete